MSFQSTVNIETGFGIVGDFFDDSPRVVSPYELVSADAAYNVIGRAFTVSSADPADGSASAIAAAGGSGVFAGLLVNSKNHTLWGTSSGTLAATLALPNYSIGELCTMGHVNVAVPAAVSIGDQLTYNTTTGVLGSVTPVGTATYSQSTTTITVTAVGASTQHIGVGSVFATSAGPATVTALGTGTGGAGTYTVNTSATVSSETKSVTSVAPSGYALIANSSIIKYAPTAAGTAVVELK